MTPADCSDQLARASAQRLYDDDLAIARALLRRDPAVTRDFFYRRCYPLFKSVYAHYHTDCASVLEFVNEIYLLVLTPGAATGQCQLQNYRGQSSLASWLKSVCLYYCYGRYERRERMPMATPLPDSGASDEKNFAAGDRFLDRAASVSPDTASLDSGDLETILRLMPNPRYRRLIRLRYLQGCSNEETAQAMGMSMANYYNRHKLAKEQFLRTLNNEQQWTS